MSFAGVTPAMVLAAGLLAGDGIAALSPCTLPPWAVSTYAASAFLLSRAPPPISLFAYAAAAFLVGFMRANAVYNPGSFPAGHVASWALPSAYEVEARVRSGNLVAGGKTALVIDVLRVRHGGTWRTASGRVRVSVYRSTRVWAEGQVFRAFLKLRRPRNFGNPGEFSYVSYLARQGIYVTAAAESDQSWQLVGQERPWRGALARWRRRVAALFEREAPPRSAAVLRALIVGDQSGISPDLRDAFSRVGVGHVLSISGLHVALVAGAGYAAARFALSGSEAVLLRLNVPKVAGALSLVPVGFYAAIAGESVATQRAILMLAVVLGGLLSNREAYFLNVLAVAAVGVVFADPGVTADVSFQLSFVAVWALVIAAGVFRTRWPTRIDEANSNSAWRRYLLSGARYLAASLWLSFAAGAATAPFTAWHFFQVPLIGPLANLVLVPLLGSLAVLLGLCAAFAEPWCSAVAAVFARAGGLAVEAGCALLQQFDRFPYAALRGIALNGLEVAAVLAFLALIAHGRGKLRVVGVGLAVCLVALGTASRVGSALGEGKLRLVVISVGQANAMLVQFPDNVRWLIDGGGIGTGSFDVGARVIGPLLWKQGIRELDAVLLSHPQFDHFGALASILPLFRPSLFFHNGQAGNGLAYRKLEQALKTNGATPVALYRGFERCLAGVHVAVWHPASQAVLHNPNHGSMVLSLHFAGRTVLLPGDIEAPQERELLTLQDWGPVDLLLVPHHGSRTSSTWEFVSTLRPRLAIVSAGWHNRFRFPHREVQRRYAQVGTTLLRTDWDGAIEVTIDPLGTMRWRTTLPPWNQWREEPLVGPLRTMKFVDSTCGQG
ncbi:MAG: DNA internalization-related competence protein ComEC/Rec2 [Candidatus Binatia bacterium]|nr:DNA internalization-related competence protein ComEC/Rec2 [Candidatus Binatia bacterium]